MPHCGFAAVLVVTALPIVLGTSQPAQADTIPMFSISDAVVQEGDSGESSLKFTVTRTPATAEDLANALADDPPGQAADDAPRIPGAPTILLYSTHDGTATGGGGTNGDYAPSPNPPGNVITFLPTDTTKTITVFVHGDPKVEANETLTVRLSDTGANQLSGGVVGEVNVAIADGVGVGTILNDDVPGGPAAPTGLVEMTPMEHAVTATGEDAAPLIADARRNLGFAIGFEVRTLDGTRDRRVVVHDLAHTDRGIVARYPSQETPPQGLPAADFTSDAVFRSVVDEGTGRLIVPETLPTGGFIPCSETAGIPTLVTGRVPLHVFAFDAAPDPNSGLPATLRKLDINMPCSGANRFFASAAAIYETGTGATRARKLLLAGTYSTDFWRCAPIQTDACNNDGQPLVIRQLDLAKLYAAEGGVDPESLDWEIDLRYAGCGRWETPAGADQGLVLLQRLGPDLITYCWDTRPNINNVGGQGYVVKIPLGDDHFPDTIGPPLRDPTNSPSLLPPFSPVGSPPSPGTNPQFEPLAIVGACLEAAGPSGDVERCLTAGAEELLRQNEPTLGQVGGDIEAVENWVNGLAPQPPDPNAVDPDNPTRSKFIINVDARRIPTLPNTVYPLADPASNRVLLLTNDTVNGNAVWVFDPRKERFVGVATGGFLEARLEKSAAAVDPVRGRAYLLTNGGIMGVSVRQSPIPPGKIHPVVAHPDQTTQWRRMAVAPELHRIFVTLATSGGFHGYAVIEDTTPDPAPSEPFNPDSLTQQIDEDPATTEVDKSGTAFASGAHVIVVGGIPRAVNQLDPFCESPIPAFNDAAFEREQFGSCLADQVVAKGAREYYSAYTEAGAGTAAGSSAEASGFFIPTTEQPTDSDIKNVGGCGQRTAQALSDQIDYSPLCDPIQGAVSGFTRDDLRRGTSGGTDAEPGTGFPVPAARCTDFGTTRGTSSAPQDARNAILSASVSCDHLATKSVGTAHSGVGVPLPESLDVLVDVGTTHSEVTTRATAFGQQTTAIAKAENVRVGPLHIGEIRTEATVTTKGRTNTAQFTFKRVWCRVTVDGNVPVPEELGTGCADPAEKDGEIQGLIRDVNRALVRVRLDVPEVDTVKTPGGAQAVVTKATNVRAADKQVNGDGSFTVPGLQAIAYNDGAEGANRVIIQFAGVHAESRYGITPILDFANPDFPETFVKGSQAARSMVGPTLRRPGKDYLETINGQLAASGSAGDVDGGTDSPLEFFRNILRWLINNWREAILVFFVLAILATPLYLGVRRRAFERELAL